MPWEPGTLLGLLDPTQPFGKYPGGSLFVALRADRITAGVIVLTPHGTQALIPPGYLVSIQGVTPVPPGTIPSGGKG